MYAYDAYLSSCAVQHQTALISLDEPLKSVAQRQLSTVFDLAQSEGEVRVTRRDGGMFVIQTVF
jgi:hypothetical protein